MYTVGCVLSQSVVSDSLQPLELLPSRLLCSWGFSRQEYRSGLQCPPPGDLPNPGIESRSHTWQVDSLPSESSGKPTLCAKFGQSCPTLSFLAFCDPMDCGPPGSSVHGTLQARILEWVVMPSSRESSQPRDRTQVSNIAGRFFTI